MSAKLAAAIQATRKRRSKNPHSTSAAKKADWVAIRALWLGGMQSQELAAKFGVDANYIRAKASNERWLKRAVEQTPALVADQIAKQRGAQTANLISELWAERGEMIREKEFVVAEKVARHAELMDEEVLINKIDKVKTAFDMGRRASGIDRMETSPNAVNIAVLGDISGLQGEMEIYRRKQIKKL